MHSHQQFLHSFSQYFHIPICSINFLEFNYTHMRNPEEEYVSFHHKLLNFFLQLVGPGGERQPSEIEVRTAIWEACGDSGALQLLVDLLNMK